MKCFRKCYRYCKSIIKVPRSDKYTKSLSTKAPSKQSSIEKDDSYFSPSSSSETLTDKTDNRKKIYYKKKK